MTSKGYAISIDQGQTWQWADPKTIKESTITFQAPINAKEVNTSINIPSSTFEVPAGYQINDVQQMMNQLKKQLPAKK